MKRPSYKRAVDWIANEDEPDELDLEIVADTISTVLVAELWGVEPEKVAADVVKLRLKLLGHSCETCGMATDKPSVVCSQCEDTENYD